MDENKEISTKQEVCTIRTAFPVTTDEQAIDIKKKISIVLSEIPEAQIHFTLMSVPPSGQKNRLSP